MKGIILPIAILDAPKLTRSRVQDIQFKLHHSSHVYIKVSDWIKMQTETLLDADQQREEYSLQINTNHFSKGVCLVKMITDSGIVRGKSYEENKKLIIQ